jgi:hypothetical protein
MAYNKLSLNFSNIYTLHYFNNYIICAILFYFPFFKLRKFPKIGGNARNDN